MTFFKTLFSAFCLLTLTAMTAQASYIQNDYGQLKPSNSVQKPLIFQENGNTVAFGAMVIPQSNRSMVVMSDAKHKEPLWQASSDELGHPVKWTYNIIQWQDTDTNRFFYTVTSFWTMDSTENVYLVGYNKDNSKVNEYINGNKVSSLPGNGPVILKRNDLLYLMKRGRHWGDDGEVYQLQWSEDKQWFGYEYLPNGLPKNVSTDKLPALPITCTISSAKSKPFFSPAEITLHVGQQARILLSNESITPGSISWNWRSGSGQNIISKIPEGFNHPGPNMLFEFEGMHPGWMQLRLVANGNQDGILTIHVIG